MSWKSDNIKADPVSLVVAKSVRDEWPLVNDRSLVIEADGKAYEFAPRSLGISDVSWTSDTEPDMNDQTAAPLRILPSGYVNLTLREVDTRMETQPFAFDFLKASSVTIAAIHPIWIR